MEQLVAPFVGKALQVEIDYERFNNLSASLHCAFTAKGDIVYVSETCEAILGYAPEELINKNYKEFLHCQELQPEKEKWNKKAWAGQPHSTVNHYLRKDGSLVTLKWNLQWVHEEALIYGVAQQHTAPEPKTPSLKTLEARYQALTEFGYDMVFIVNAQNQYIYVNETAARLLGFQPEELLGKHRSQMIHPEDQRSVLQSFEQGLQKGNLVNTRPFRHKTASGQWLWVESILSNQLKNPAIKGVVLKARDITNRIEAEQKLKEREHHYYSLFALHPDAAFSLDIDGYVKSVNAIGCSLLQLPEEQILNQHFTTFLHDRQLDQGLHLFWSSIAGKPYHIETVFHNVKNKKEEISLTLLPIHADDQIIGLYAFVRNITTAKKTERELKKLSAVTSKIKHPILVTDRRGRIEWVNKAFTLDTGYALEDIKGLKPTDAPINADTNIEAYRHMAVKVSKNKELVRDEFLRYNKDGSITWLHLELTPILDENGQINRVVTIATDITDTKRSQQERIKLTDVLLRQNKDLQQFGYIVSHNLRAPVANIMGLVDLLPIHRQDTAYVDKIVDNLKGASHHLDNVIRDLNHILTLRSDLVETKEKINLCDLTNDILNSVRQQLDGSNALVEIDFVPNSYLTSVRSYITSILQNLITNAIKYRSPERQLKLTLRTYFHKKGSLCLEVQDNGLGINLHKEKDNVFKLYKRFHFHTEGKGLGLHLVKTQIEALGGKISVCSTVGQGTTFTVHFKK